MFHALKIFRILKIPDRKLSDITGFLILLRQTNSMQKSKRSLGICQIYIFLNRFVAAKPGKEKVCKFIRYRILSWLCQLIQILREQRNIPLLQLILRLFYLLLIILLPLIFLFILQTLNYEDILIHLN